MIFYFSATGNSKRTAERLAEALHTSTLSIEQFDPAVTYDDTDCVGVVFPVFFMGLPTNVENFFKTVQIANADYTFLVTTYGVNCGGANEMGAEILKSRGYHVDALFSIKCVDNWTVAFDLTNSAHVQHFLDMSEAEIEEMIPLLQAHKKGDFARNTMPIKDAIDWYKRYEEVRKTSHLHVLDKCIGCGLCARRCPVKAIEMVDKKPHWVKEQCLMCFGCLHRCPAFAIQYDDKTENHGQYKNPYTRV